MKSGDRKVGVTLNMKEDQNIWQNSSNNLWDVITSV